MAHCQLALRWQEKVWFLRVDQLIRLKTIKNSFLGFPIIKTIYYLLFNLPLGTCLSVCRCCSCCCRFHWLCWMSSSRGAAAGGATGSWASIWIGGGGMSTTSLAPGRYKSTKQEAKQSEGLVKTGLERVPALRLQTRCTSRQFDNHEQDT